MFSYFIISTSSRKCLEVYLTTQSSIQIAISSFSTVLRRAIFYATKKFF